MYFKIVRSDRVTVMICNGPKWTISARGRFGPLNLLQDAKKANHNDLVTISCLKVFAVNFL